MKSSVLFLMLFSVIALLGCSQQEEKIINPKDYESSLGRQHDESLENCNVEIAFWNKKLSKVRESETYRIKLAGLFSNRFTLTGRMEDIQASDSLYQLVVKGTSQEYASIHRAIAANCITKHQFRQAREEILRALEIGEGKAASLFMLVDVNLELGDYDGAKTTMKEFVNKNFFAFLIREAKMKDHEGVLDTAILLMEKALEKVKDRPSLFLWTQSNLADMYGHAGRVKESYQAYIRVLQQDPDYDYALKGIAWIAFSNDGNFAEAKRIANHIQQKRATPDMHLFLAEIAEAENNLPEKARQIKLFMKAAAEPKYGDMYNKYIAMVEAEEFSNPSKSIEIAKREIYNRPTPQSYDLLAWAYFQKGNLTEALAIVREHVENSSHEPDLLYHLGMIYKANGMNKEASRYFKQAAENYFELGPAITKKIKEQLEG